MLLDTQVGNLVQPLTGRCWDRETIGRQFRARVEFLNRRGLEPGDRVFLHYGDALEFFVDLLAIWTLGGCAVPIDQTLSDIEIDNLAQASRPRFSLWIDTPRGELAATLSAQGTQILRMSGDHLNEKDGPPAPPPRPRLSLDQDALILFKWSAAGHPKGVVHTHRSLRAKWLALFHSLDVRHFRKTLWLSHGHGGHGLICNALFPWLAGQDLHILQPCGAEQCLGAVLDEYGITFVSARPPVWRQALNTGPPPSRGTLQRVFSDSAPLSTHLWRQIAKWTGARAVLNSYGTTETGGWVAGTTLPAFTPQDGLIGVPWGATVKVLRSASTDIPPAYAEECAPGAEGYLWLNTPALMSGYLDRDDLTQQVVSQGWFLTGDIAVVRDARLYLRGRARDTITKNGMRIHPGDIDNVVERFPATKDVCTFGMEGSRWGQCVAVAVVLDDRSPAMLTSLRTWVDERLTDHSVPERWYFIDAIPVTSRGHVNRDELARRCAALEPVTLHPTPGEPAP